MNSKIKFLTVGFILVISAILLTGAGCVKKGKVSPSPTSKEETTAPKEEEKAPEAGIGKMTDEIYIELTAQNSYNITKDLSWLQEGGGWEKLFKEYDVTNENFEAYTRELEKNLQHYQEVLQRVPQRLQELQKVSQ